MTTYHLRTNDIWDVWETLVLKYPLDIFSNFWKTYRFERFYFFVIILKFGEPQSHAPDIGNIRTFWSYLALEGIPKLLELEKNICFIYEDLLEGGVDLLQSQILWPIKTVSSVNFLCF